MRIRSNAVMSVEQAKLLLGDEALEMTDDEIQKMIDDFDMMAQHAIQLVQKFKTKDDITD